MRQMSGLLSEPERHIKRMICQIRVSQCNTDFTTHEPKKMRIFLYRSIDLLIYTFGWKRNVRKDAGVRGLQRRDHQGRVVPASSTGNPCDCRNKCFQLVELELQYHIITQYNNMKDKVQQDQYLRGQIVASDPTWVGTQGKEDTTQLQTEEKRTVPTSTKLLRENLLQFTF